MVWISSSRTVMAVLTALFAAGSAWGHDISVKTAGGSKVDFGEAFTADAPGSLPDRQIDFDVRVKSQGPGGGPYTYTIDFPATLSFEEAGGGTGGELELSGPSEGQTDNKGRDSFTLTATVGDIPATGGDYEATIPVTVGVGLTN